MFGDGDRDAVGIDFWNASVPIIEDGTRPVMQISGMESRRASAMAVTRLVAPGPLQAIQTAGLPQVRAMLGDKACALLVARQHVADLCALA